MNYFSDVCAGLMSVHFATCDRTSVTYLQCTCMDCMPPNQRIYTSSRPILQLVCSLVHWLISNQRLPCFCPASALLPPASALLLPCFRLAMPPSSVIRTRHHFLHCRRRPGRGVIPPFPPLQRDLNPSSQEGLCRADFRQSLHAPEEPTRLIKP